MDGARAHSGGSCTSEGKKETGTRLAKMTERKAVIKNADMSEEMQQDAIDCATQVRARPTGWSMLGTCSTRGELASRRKGEGGEGGE